MTHIEIRWGRVLGTKMGLGRSRFVDRLRLLAIGFAGAMVFLGLMAWATPRYGFLVPYVAFCVLAYVLVRLDLGRKRRRHG